MIVSMEFRGFRARAGQRHVLTRLARQSDRHFGGVQLVEWDVHRRAGQLVAACRLHARGGTYRARGTSLDLPRAAREALDRLTRQRLRPRPAGGGPRCAAGKARAGEAVLVIAS